MKLNVLLHATVLKTKSDYKDTKIFNPVILKYAEVRRRSMEKQERKANISAIDI